MTLDDARQLFEGGNFSPPANLYEAGYAYALAQGFDPIENGGWKQALSILEAIAPTHPALVSEALAFWMSDSHMMSVREAAEYAGALAATAPFTNAYFRAEIERGRLKAYKRGTDWVISDRDFREWWKSGRGGKRGSRAHAAKRPKALDALLAAEPGRMIAVCKRVQYGVIEDGVFKGGWVDIRRAEGDSFTVTYRLPNGGGWNPIRALHGVDEAEAYMLKIADAGKWKASALP